MAKTQNFLVALWRSTKSTNHWSKGDKPCSIVTGQPDEAGMSTALQTAIELAHQKFSTEPTNPRALKIFLAPEYFFAHEEKYTGGPHSLEQAEKNTILSKLVTISRSAPNMLIVPGTIAWRTPLNAPSKKAVDDPAAARRAKAADNFKQDFQFKKDKNLNAGMFEEYVEPTVEKIATSPDFSYLKRNTCYIAFNGKVLKYHKRAGFGEEKQDRDAIFTAGHQTGFFTIGLIRFGLEVCFDHNQGYLRSSEMSGIPHVHLIVSNSTDTKEGNLICSGFAAHSSTSIAATKLILISTHSPATKYDSVTALAGWGDLDLYRCSVTDDSFTDEGGLGLSPTIASDTLSEKTGIVTS